ncbi:hypothetical protein BZA70DRAFT_108583 [Myxozyma melibiosi]|uniref:CUE domain-containing protein n=1 Tax=Myxozyma melibiosi TaxID=54550 RepID=A0ABR1F9U3_9ASCO
MATDSTTTTFIACIIIGFLVVRWYVSAPQQQIPAGATGTPQSRATASSTGVAGLSSLASELQRPRSRRPVTQGMIEVVQSVAPTLTVEQIRFDLERSGSVEATIDRFLAEGGLPMPPNAQPRAQPAPSSAAGSSSTPATISSSLAFPDLITRYHLETKIGADGLPIEPKLAEDITSAATSSSSPPPPPPPSAAASSSSTGASGKKMKWSGSKEERQAMLRKQREDMILKARRKLEAQLEAEKPSAA